MYGLASDNGIIVGATMSAQFKMGMKSIQHQTMV